jgi:hypothetical protein
MGAAVFGGFVVWALWRFGTWSIPGCVLAVGLIFFGVQALQALTVLAWFRWAARRTARDVTCRPPRAAA